MYSYLCPLNIPQQLGCITSQCYTISSYIFIWGKGLTFSAEFSYTEYYACQGTGKRWFVYCHGCGMIALIPRALHAPPEHKKKKEEDLRKGLRLYE